MAAVIVHVPNRLSSPIGVVGGSAGTSATTRAAAGGGRGRYEPRSFTTTCPSPIGKPSRLGYEPSNDHSGDPPGHGPGDSTSAAKPPGPASPLPDLPAGLPAPPRAPRCRVCGCCHRQRGGGRAISSSAHAAGSSTPPFSSETSFGRLRSVPRPDYEPLSIPPMRNRLAGWLRFDTRAHRQLRVLTPPLHCLLPPAEL